MANYGFWNGAYQRNFDPDAPELTALQDLYETLMAFEDGRVALGFDPTDPNLTVEAVDARVDRLKDYTYIWGSERSEFDKYRRLIEAKQQDAHYRILGHAYRQKKAQAVFSAIKDWSYIGIYLWSPWLVAILVGTLLAFACRALASVMLRPNSVWINFAATGFFAIMSAIGLTGVIFRRSYLIWVSALLSTAPFALLNLAKTQGLLTSFEQEASSTGTVALGPVAAIIGVFWAIVFARIITNRLTAEAVDSLLNDVKQTRTVRAVTQSPVVVTGRRRLPGGTALIAGALVALVAALALFKLVDASQELKERQIRQQSEAEAAAAKAKARQEASVTSNENATLKAKLRTLEAKADSADKAKEEAEDALRRRDRSLTAASSEVPAIDRFEVWSKYPTDNYEDDYVPFQDPTVVVAWNFKNLVDAVLVVDGKETLRLAELHGTVKFRPDTSHPDIKLKGVTANGTQIERPALMQNIPSAKTVDQFFADMRREHLSLGSPD